MTEDPGFLAIKLSPQGIITGSVIAPLKAMDSPARLDLAFALELAAEKVRDGDIARAIWPLGEALKLLGFTVERKNG